MKSSEVQANEGTGKKADTSGKTVLITKVLPALIDLANNTQNTIGCPFIFNFTAVKVFRTHSKDYYYSQKHRKN